MTIPFLITYICYILGKNVPDVGCNRTIIGEGKGKRKERCGKREVEREGELVGQTEGREGKERIWG